MVPKKETIFHAFVNLIENVRATGVELLGESSGYNYTLEYITTHLPGESSENKMRFLEGYSTLYIQVPLATEHPKGQGQKCRSR